MTEAAVEGNDSDENSPTWSHDRWLWEEPVSPSKSSVEAVCSEDREDDEDMPDDSDSVLADPEEMLRIHGIPASVEEWERKQHLIWPGHKALPEGWIRVW